MVFLPSRKAAQAASRSPFTLDAVTDARDFLRQALDPIRLAVLGRAVEGSVDAENLAGRLEVPVRKVRRAIGRLRAAGLLTEELALDREAVRRLAGELPRAAVPGAEVGAAGTWTDDEVVVLGRFFRGNRLVSIPAARGKRLVVLDRLAQEFEPGLRYEEADVNFVLQMWHPDYAALRRYLVDESFLTRADGVYWRTGGRFDTSEAETGDAGR